MAVEPDEKRVTDHHNALGFFRLLFATLVIIAHTPELIDGNRSRELLTRMFGTISFGDLAVDGFFVISGYLIVGSFVKRPEIRPYLIRRVTRIYPAFILACLISIFVVAPLGGGIVSASAAELTHSFLLIVALQPPDVTTAFAGQPYPLVNGPVWTIAYEFRCYLLVVILYYLGMLRRPWLLVGLIGLSFLAFLSGAAGRFGAALVHELHLPWIAVGRLDSTARFVALFLSGSIFYVERNRIAYSYARTAAAGVALVACLMIGPLAEIGIAIFGAYIIFAIAGLAAGSVLGRINNKNDISYGVYLYAWPVEKLLLWYHPGIGPVPAAALTIAIAYGCGVASWILIERPIMKVAARLTRRPRAEAPAAIGSFAG